MMPASVATAVLDDLWVQVCPVTAAGPEQLALLDADERARAARFRMPADRDRFVTARVALRTALATGLGVHPGDVPIRIDPFGRPYCPHGPAFSISHANAVAILAIAPAQSAPVGIDIEYAGRPIAFEKIAPVVCAARELDWLWSDEAGVEDRFLRLWTAKEAALKSWGRGFALDPRDARYDPLAATVHFVGSARCEPVMILHVTVPPGYVGSLALGSAPPVAG